MRSLFSGLCGLVLLCLSQPASAAGTAMLLQYEGAISPASSDFIERGIEKGEAAGAGVIVLQLDTPGGLDTSMRSIVQAILSSRVPVIVYVAPAGARAASAGTYILYASHLAAMAPGTNLGAATPVKLGGGGGLPGPQPPADGDEAAPAADNEEAMARKRLHDAAAYLRSLAQLRGRNEAWAERAVREGVSLSAAEALDAGVIEVMAANLDELLDEVHGRVVILEEGDATLDTKDIAVTRIEPDWRTRLLAVIADPNIAYILILIGIYGLIFEFYNPGFIFPGVVGAICLVLALFALQVLPINYAGLGLLILGVIFMVAEAFMPSFGALGIGGLIAFIIGSVILIDTDMPGYGISPALIATFSIISGVFFLGVVGMAIKARERPVVSGQEEMLHASGIALEDFTDTGYILIHGEHWRASASQPIHKGVTVRVTGMDGLTLHVEPEEES